MRDRKLFRYITVLISFLMLVVSCVGCGKRVTKFENASVAMGTVISQTVYVNVTGFGATERGNQVMTSVEEQLGEIEEEYSWRKDTSTLARINATAGYETGYELSEEQSQTFAKVFEICASTQGAFDVSLGVLTKLWNIEGNLSKGTTTVPTQEQIQQALSLCGYEQVLLAQIQMTQDQMAADKDDATAKESMTLYLPEGMSLDLGGVAKGIASNQILSYLESNQDVRGAVISLGGNVITYGDRGDGSSWKVGIVNPLDPETNIGYLTLKGSHMVITSGDYERFFEVEGQRYHHILDPKTGYPAASGIKSVTVWCQDGIIGDALSTACFVVGVEQALELAEKYDVELLLVTDEGELVMTEGMKQVFIRQE